MDIEKYRLKKARAKGRRVNYNIDNPAKIRCIKRRNAWEPKVEFRDCRELIIDFIRQHEHIACVQNYLYDEWILRELSKKKSVQSIFQFQEWMMNNDDYRTADMDKWILKKPFYPLAVLENNPTKHERQRRILHHKFFIGWQTEGSFTSRAHSYKDVNLLYGTYNITNAAMHNLESMMEFKGKYYPETIALFIREYYDITVSFVQFNYKLWASLGKQDPFEFLDKMGEDQLHGWEITEGLQEFFSSLGFDNEKSWQNIRLYTAKLIKIRMHYYYKDGKLPEATELLDSFKKDYLKQNQEALGDCN